MNIQKNYVLPYFSQIQKDLLHRQCGDHDVQTANAGSDEPVAVLGRAELEGVTDEST